jgi:hypothetical protein
MAAVTKQQQAETQSIARPLKVLVPLIKKDIELMEMTKDETLSPYYQSIGEKLIEAKENLTWGSWAEWLKHNFEFNQKTAENYMNYANELKIETEVSILTYSEYLKLKKKQPKPKETILGGIKHGRNTRGETINSSHFAEDLIAQNNAAAL